MELTVCHDTWTFKRCSADWKFLWDIFINSSNNYNSCGQQNISLWCTYAHFKRKHEMASCRWGWRGNTDWHFLRTTGRSQIGTQQDFLSCTWKPPMHDIVLQITSITSDGAHLAGPLRMMISGSPGFVLKLTWAGAEMAKNLHQSHGSSSGPQLRVSSLNSRSCANPAPEQSYIWAQGREEESFLLLAIKLICLDINLNFCEPGIGMIQCYSVLFVMWP